MKKLANFLYSFAMATGLVGAAILANYNQVWLGLGVLLLLALVTAVKVQSKLPTGEG